MESSTSLEFFLLASFIMYQIYKYFCGRFNLFSTQGIPGPRPIPIFGTWWRSWEHKPLDIAQQYYEKYGKIYCTFLGRMPVLHVHDVDLLRSILVKDSNEHFAKRSRRPVTSGENEYMDRALPMLHGDQWKVLRRLATTSFSPQLLKQRFDYVNGSLLEILAEWKRVVEREGKMDLRVQCELLCEEIQMNYSIGRKLGTIGNPNHPFALNARKTMETDKLSFLGTLTQLYPKLLQWLSPVMDTGNTYFVDLGKQVLRERSENRNLHHTTLEPDVIDRLLDCINGNDHKGAEHIDEVVAVAHLTSTFMSGYDVGTALTRILHCLAVHPEIQTRCREEIQTALLDGTEISFQLLANLPYLDQCIREALRLYPTIAITYRECTKEKQYKNLFIPKGTSIQCPMFMLQRDPELFPDPLKYDPNRFSPGRTSDRESFNFLSFGQGPRSCFAQKFAMFVLKHCLVHLLATFEFGRIPETKDPICFTSGPNGVLTAKNMFVGVKPVQQQQIAECSW